MSVVIGGPSSAQSGNAGGVLAGAYPNPSFAVDMATQAELDAVAAAGVATNPYSGGKWTVLGTSITDFDQYTVPLATALGVTVQNLGVSGATLTYQGSGDGVITDKLALVDADADLVTIEAGINEFIQGLTLGAAGNTSANTSFYGALYNALLTLIASNPAADIAVFTPYGNETYGGYTGTWNTPNVAGDRIQDYWAVIHEVCGIFSVPVIKVGEESGVGGPTSALYLGDNIHPNANGGQRIADYAFPRLIAAHVGAAPTPTPAAPVNTVAPAITGTATTGSTLTCSTGTWTGYPTLTYARQWKRNTGSGFSNIAGEINSTYVLGVADEGAAVKCTVTASNTQGSAPADSNTVNPTAGGGGSAPAAISSWEADDLAGSNGSSVSSLPHRSSDTGGVDVAQGTGANQPTLVTAAINGHKALSFDGTNDVLTSSSSLTQAQPFAVVGVVKANSLTPGNNGYRNFISDALGEVVGHDGSHWVMYGGGGIPTGSTPVDTNAHVISAEFNGASSKVYVDGTLDVTANGGTSGLGGNVSIGASGPNNAWSGLIAAVRVVPLADRHAHELELGAKYGVTVA
jgi:lysophospholipase L1-like esterase